MTSLIVDVLSEFANERHSRLWLRFCHDHLDSGPTTTGSRKPLFQLTKAVEAHGRVLRERDLPIVFQGAF